MKTQYLNEKAARYAGVAPGHYPIHQPARLVWRDFSSADWAGRTVLRAQQWQTSDSPEMHGRSYLVMSNLPAGRDGAVFGTLLSENGVARVLGTFGCVDHAKRAAEGDFEAHRNDHT